MNTITVTGTDSTALTIDNGQFVGLVDGRMVFRTETLGAKTGIVQPSEVQLTFVPVADVARVDVETDEFDTADELGQHFTPDWKFSPSL